MATGETGLITHTRLVTPTATTAAPAAAWLALAAFLRRLPGFRPRLAALAILSAAAFAAPFGLPVLGLVAGPSAGAIRLPLTLPRSRAVTRTLLPTSAAALTVPLTAAPWPLIASVVTAGLLTPRASGILSPRASTTLLAAGPLALVGALLVALHRPFVTACPVLCRGTPWGLEGLCRWLRRPWSERGKEPGPNTLEQVLLLRTVVRLSLLVAGIARWLALRSPGGPGGTGAFRFGGRLTHGDG